MTRVKFVGPDLFGSTTRHENGRVEDPSRGLRQCTGYTGEPCVVGPHMQPISEFTRCGRGYSRRWQCRTCDNYSRRTRAQGESEDLTAKRNAAVYKRLGGPYCTYERWYRLLDLLAVYYGYTSCFARRDRQHRAGEVEATQPQAQQSGWLVMVVVPHWHASEKAARQHEQYLYDTHWQRQGSDVKVLNRMRPAGVAADLHADAA